jgi:hypothetical protein
MLPISPSDFALRSCAKSLAATMAGMAKDSSGWVCGTTHIPDANNALPDACCSCCGQPETKVGPMVETTAAGNGPHFRICKGCAQLAKEVIDREILRLAGEDLPPQSV